jgi:NAD(P)-dependent dehydrogenase (short-subunit alcohol dehydrogenase family)
MDEFPVAIVTGGAAGIGEACVRSLAGRGYRVLIADIDGPAGHRLADELVGGGGPAGFIQCDVSLRADVAQAVDRAMSQYGRLDVMVNNAGIAPVGDDLLRLSDELFDRIIGVNLRGVFLGLQTAGAAMVEQGFGSIVSMASIGALPGVLGGFAYDSTKAGVVKMTILAAAQLAEHNVRVNAVCPGMHLTPMAELRTPGADRAAKERLFARMQPIPRFGRPEDVAEVVSWLVSESAGFVTGQSIVVDGGLVSSGWGSRMSEIFRSASSE